MDTYDLPFRGLFEFLTEYLVGIYDGFEEFIGIGDEVGNGGGVGVYIIGVGVYCIELTDTCECKSVAILEVGDGGGICITLSSFL